MVSVAEEEVVGDDGRGRRGNLRLGVAVTKEEEDWGAVMATEKEREGKEEARGERPFF